MVYDFFESDLRRISNLEEQIGDLEERLARLEQQASPQPEKAVVYDIRQLGLVGSEAAILPIGDVRACVNGRLIMHPRSTNRAIRLASNEACRVTRGPEGLTIQVAHGHWAVKGEPMDEKYDEEWNRIVKIDLVA